MSNGTTPSFKEASARAFYEPLRPKSSPELTQQDLETLPDSIQNVTLEDSNASSPNETEDLGELSYPDLVEIPSSTAPGNLTYPDLVDVHSRAVTPHRDPIVPQDDKDET